MATKTITGQVQIRNDIAQNWAVANPVLLAGELGYETDTHKGKVGDGQTTWNSLGYAWGGGTVPTISTGSANGTISVDGTDVAVKGFSDVELKQDASEKYDKLWSMGEQLIINGNGVLGDNTNFSALTFDPVVANASAGSFTREGHSYTEPQTDEYIPLFPDSKYVLSMDLKSDGTANTQIFAYLNFFDADKNAIVAYHHMYIANTLTTLSQDLKAGDTVVHFTDLTNWNVTTTESYQHGFIFWNYTNRKGYTYPEQTYSRNAFLNKYTDNSAVNKTNNTITLSSAWTGATIPAGTKVSQSSSGGSYKYAFYTGHLPATWANYSGYYDGVDYSGKNATTKMPPGTAYAKLGFLWNYQSTGGQIWATNISLKAVEKDIVYTVDENKNVTFPAKVTATGGFTGDLTGTASKATSVAIEAGTSNVDRYVWFSWSGTGNEGKACYDAAFKYNPYTDNLTVGKINGMAVNSFVKDTDLSAVATSGSYADLSNKPTIPEAYTLPKASANTLGGIKVGTNLSIDSNGVLNAKAVLVSACATGDYHAASTVITLTVSLADYNKLLFVCGTDSATEGVQTIEVPLNTGRTYHRLVWFTGDVSTNYQWDGIARNAKAITVTINTSTNKVTIVSSNVTANGIRQIYAE